jgi:hypothetical protein
VVVGSRGECEGARSRGRVGLLRGLTVREVVDDWGLTYAVGLGLLGGSWREWARCSRQGFGVSCIRSAFAASAGGRRAGSSSSRSRLRSRTECGCGAVQ